MSENKDPIQVLIDHVEGSSKLIDSTATGDEDVHYYELSASVVDAAIELMKQGLLEDDVFGIPWIEIDFGQKPQGWKLYSDKRTAWAETSKASKDGSYSGGYYGPVRPLMLYMIPRRSLDAKQIEALNVKGKVRTDDLWEPKFKAECCVVS